MLRIPRWAATLAVAALALGACGGGPSDDEASGSEEDYCELSNRLNEGEDLPTEDELDELIAVAPDEIRDEVETLVAAIRSGDFFSEEVSDAEEAVTDYEEENCGGDLSGGASPDGDDGAPVIVTFGSISSGDTISNPVVVEPTVRGASIAPAASSGEGEGHYHVMIDTDCPPVGDTIPGDENHVHFGDGSTTLDLPELEAGDHQLCLVLGDGAHRVFGAAQTINVTVAG